MKKFFPQLLIASAVFAFSCNANDSKTTTTLTDTAANQTAKPITKPATVSDKETQATAELCKCVNDYMGNMSPKVKEILIAAGKSENPVVVLTTELQKIRSEEEQQNLAREFQQFENNTQLQTCSEDVKKKYNLDEKDLQSRDRILKAAEKNKDCELVYALMKIGIQQERQAGGR